MSDETSQPADFLKIDPLHLDREWLGQAELYFNYASRAVKAQRTRDALKAELDVVASEVEQFIRAKPEKYQIVKVTEAAIKVAVIKHPKYQEANENVIAAQYRYGIAQAAVAALDHRKRALTMLVNLHLSNYFADPKISGAGREKIDDAQGRRVAKRTELKRGLEEDVDLDA